MTKNNLKLNYLFSFSALMLMLVMGGCASSSANDSHEQKYKQLSAPLFLGQLTKIYGARKQGHGPFVRFELPDQKLELWAFYGAKEDKLTSDSAALDEIQLNNRLDALHVMLLLEVEKNNEDNAKVVWPEQFVGQSVEQAYKTVYKWVEQENSAAK